MLPLAAVLLSFLVLSPAAGATAPSPIAAAFDERSPVVEAWPARHVAALRAFYEVGGFQPRWTGENGLDARGAALVAAIERIDDHGLSPEALDLATIRALALREDEAGRRLLELQLSSAFLRLAAWLDGTEREEGAPRHRVFALAPDGHAPADLARLLDIAAPVQVLATLAPASSQYQRLRAARAIERAAMEKAVAWPKVPAGETLRPGRADPRIAAVRRRLAASGEHVEQVAHPDRYDPKLVEAVKAFQVRHGLEPDGAIGRTTVVALNMGPAERLVQIDATLERWRRMPRDLGARHLLVNVPAYRLSLMEGDRAALEMKVVVGTPRRPTPAFSSKVSGVEINPTWSVPAKLAVEDIVPQIRRNPNYLEEHGIRVLVVGDGGVRRIDPATIDWERQTGRTLPFRFRQDPGAMNALGKVKMVLPNDEAIYLHDTPKRSLFRRAQRAYSSGCIRLERPIELAHLLLREGAGWEEGQIEAAFERTSTRAVPLAAGLPIHIAYLTVWVTDDGKVQVYDDVYDQDRRVVEMLRARQPLAALSPAGPVRTAAIGK
ncbi:MAG: murein L,D-transpeptidase [Alphaproteobacteria bacterium]